MSTGHPFDTKYLRLPPGVGTKLLALALCTAGPVFAAGYPDDAYSRPPIDHRPTFETLVGCSLPGVPWRTQHYRENSLYLVHAEGRSATRWRFQSIDAGQATLILSERIRHAPEYLELTVRNNSTPAVRLRMEAHESAWQPGPANQAVAWHIGEVIEIPPKTEQICRFSFRQAAWPNRAEPAEPRYPMGQCLLQVESIEPQASYELLLSNLRIGYPPAAIGPYELLNMPANITTGSPLTFELQAAGTEAAEVVDVEFRRGAWVLWRVRLSAQERERLNKGVCRIERTVPWFLPRGDLTAGLVVDGLRAAESRTVTLRVENPTTASFPLAERRVHNGRPTFFVDGQPRVWQGYASYDYAPGNVGEFAGSGTTVFCVPTCAGMHVHPTVAAPTWQRKDRFNFDELDERVCASLAANPDALIMLRVSLALPPFWLQEHEDALVRVMVRGLPTIWEESGTPNASLASGEWRQAQEHALRTLIRHCGRQPWAKRVAGIWLTGEVTEEWFAWGCNNDLYSDYSQPNEEAFMQWLSKRGAARQRIPSPEVRNVAGRDIYPDTPDGRWAAAYHRYYSELTAETLRHFARIVKNETQGRCLVGAFYGYVIQLAGEPRQTLAAHGALREVLDDPNIDWLAGIPLHDFRKLADGYSAYVSATESILAAGKLYCNENDLFSWLHPLHWHTKYDPADPRAAAIQMHRRECANDAVHGAMAQKFSLSASWHHDVDLQAEFARQKQVYAQTMDADRTDAEEIAFLVDDTSLAWTPPGSTYLHAAHKMLLYHAARTGAPVGVWLLSDCDRLPERIRFVVIASAAAAAPADIEKLRAMIAQGGRTLLIVGPAGLIDPHKPGWNDAAVGELLGLPIRIIDQAMPGRITLPDGMSVPSVERLWPRAQLEGDALLRYADGPGAGAERPLANGGRLIWCGAPPCSTELLARWAGEAGAHTYAPAGFTVHAARGLISVTAPIKGDATLRFPSAVSVTDLFDGWQGQGTQIQCPFMIGQTRLLLTKPMTNPQGK